MISVTFMQRLQLEYNETIFILLFPKQNPDHMKD